MGLDVAMGSALSGLRTNQEAFSVLSQNIANVNTENYARRVIEQKSENIGGVGHGVSIVSVKRKVDDYLVGAIRDQAAKTSYSEKIFNYYESIENFFGRPNTDGNLNSTIDDFFSSLKSLASNPELSSLRLNTVKSGEALANKISTMSLDLQNLRYNADKEIKQGIEEINQNLAKLQDINIALSKAQAADGSTAGLLEERDNALQRIAQFMDISTFVRPDGQVFVSVANGKSILDENYYFFEYAPATGVDTFINDAPLSPVFITIENQLTGETGASKILVTGGKRDEITTEIITGKLKALFEVRDKIVPDVLTQLDNFAETFAYEFNKIHNQGVGYPPAQSLVGTKAIVDSNRTNWRGSVRISVVDDYGQPALKGDGEKLSPLTLDLSKLDSGMGAGQPTVKTIMDEINDYFYFSPTLDKTTIGNFADLKLVATSNFSVIPSGQASFDFEVENNSQLSSQFEVIGVTVTDAGAAGLVSALPGISNIIAGTKGRSNTPLTINFAGGSGGPYVVRAQVRVTDENGNVSVSTVEFTIKDNPPVNDILNSKYVATGVFSGDAVIVPAGTTQRFAKASLVDEEGKDVTSGNVGRLKIATTDSNYHIVIDEADSRDMGILAALNPPAEFAAPTNSGFSHYFGLNDFFVNSNYNKLYGTSLNMKVRSDIVKDSGLISLGALTKSADRYETQTTGYTTAAADINFGGVPSVGDTLTLNGATFTFVAAATNYDEITIGVDLPTTLNNITAKLNATNSFTAGRVDSVSYNNDGVNNLYLSYKAAGLKGNSFTIAGNFASTSASINSNPVSLTPNGSLVGGSDKTETELIKSHTYEISMGNNAVITKLAELSSNVISFKAAGGLSSATNTLIGYSAGIISFNSTAAIYAQNNYANQQMISDGFNARFQSASGVNLDEELAFTVIYQNAYSANARIIKVTKELFDVLIGSV